MSLCCIEVGRLSGYFCMICHNVPGVPINKGATTMLFRKQGHDCNHASFHYHRQRPVLSCRAWKTRENACAQDRQQLVKHVIRQLPTNSSSAPEAPARALSSDAPNMRLCITMVVKNIAQKFVPDRN